MDRLVTRILGVSFLLLSLAGAAVLFAAYVYAEGTAIEKAIVTVFSVTQSVTFAAFGVYLIREG